MSLIHCGMRESWWSTFGLLLLLSRFSDDDGDYKMLSGLSIMSDIVKGDCPNNQYD